MRCPSKSYCFLYARLELVSKMVLHAWSPFSVNKLIAVKYWKWANMRQHCRVSFAIKSAGKLWCVWPLKTNKNGNKKCEMPVCV